MNLVDCEYKFFFVMLRHREGSLMMKCLLKRKFDESWTEELLGCQYPDPCPGTRLNVPYSMVADEGCPLRENCAKKIGFNYRLLRALRCVENASGIMASRSRLVM